MAKRYWNNSPGRTITILVFDQDGCQTNYHIPEGHAVELDLVGLTAEWEDASNKVLPDRPDLEAVLWKKDKVIQDKIKKIRNYRRQAKSLQKCLELYKAWYMGLLTKNSLRTEREKNA